ncbi:MAG: hypothetical protein LBT02_03445 [Rickettsiales bacterium]|jgi:dUTP pyrophosphatase|nr:hypothetical protein [Rickettsiales bacterium]
MIELKVKKITSDARMPEQAHQGDLFDVFVNEDANLNSYEAKIVKLGIALDIPSGYRVKLFARSSLSIKKKIIVSNSVGIIDSNYKDELGLICHTLPTNKMENNVVDVKKGDKIAQLQLEKIVDCRIAEVTNLDISNDRGGGFGSTDKKQ